MWRQASRGRSLPDIDSKPLPTYNELVCALVDAVCATSYRTDEKGNVLYENFFGDEFDFPLDVLSKLGIVLKGEGLLFDIDKNQLELFKNNKGVYNNAEISSD